MKAFFGKAFYW